MSKNKKKNNRIKYLLISVVVMALVISTLCLYKKVGFKMVANADQNLAALGGTTTNTTSTTPAACQDSDGSQNYFVKGKTYGNTGSGPKWYTDSCFNITSVKEYSCMSSVYPKVNKPLDIWTDIYKCPNGCSNGACRHGNLTASPSVLVADTINAYAILAGTSRTFTNNGDNDFYFYKDATVNVLLLPGALLGDSLEKYVVPAGASRTLTNKGNNNFYFYK